MLQVVFLSNHERAGVKPVHSLLTIFNLELTSLNDFALIPHECKHLPWFFIGLMSGETTSTIFFSWVSLQTGSQRGWKKIPRAKGAGVIASAHVSNQRCDENVQISLQWTVHCMRKPLLTVSARIMPIYKQLSRSVNYLSQSWQQSSIQLIRSWYQELVTWNGGINGMSTGSPAHSLLTRPLSVHPVRPRLHSAISSGSLYAG